VRVLADGRVKRDRDEWCALIAKCESSGLAEAEFCRRQKISRNTFIKWKRRLASSSARETQPSFLEWPVPSTTSGTPALATGEFELSLPGGVTLRWKP